MKRNEQGTIFKEVRQNQIFEILNQRNTASIDYLVEHIFASPATIRRDLEQLERSGMIKRVHGGAILVDSNSTEAAQEIRKNENSDKKIVIAHLIEQFLKNNMSIFLDSSTTNRFLIQILKKFSDLVLVTNSLKMSLELLDELDSTIYIAGGLIKKNSNNTNGVLTVSFLNQFFADISLIACRGISENGCFVVHPDQSEIKKTMINKSKISVLLCDSTKFNSEYFVKFADFSDFDYLVSDKLPDKNLENAITKAGCVIITPKENRR